MPRLKLKNEQGFTMIELLFVIAIIGILAVTAISRLNQYKTRAYDSDAKANLHNLFLACKVYWNEKGGTNTCNKTIAAGTSYGFVNSATITINGSGVEDNFTATAQHDSSSNIYSINSSGNIS